MTDLVRALLVIILTIITAGVFSFYMCNNPIFKCNLSVERAERKMGAAKTKEEFYKARKEIDDAFEEVYKKKPHLRPITIK